MAVLVLAGCGPGSSLKSARRLEEKGRYPKAVLAYERFARTYPEHEGAPEALYRAGRIYAEVFGECGQAKSLFERAVRQHPSAGSWPTLARDGLVRCPEYFPLRRGYTWVIGDSQTGGRNSRIEVAVREENAVLTERIYAGKKLFRTLERHVVLEDWSLKESVAEAGRESGRAGAGTSLPGAVPFLKYPYAPGAEWRARRGAEPVAFRIEADQAKVEVRGGAFSGCLKVREAFVRYPGSWKYDYYAPGVGRVLTTVAGPGFEHRNTELLAFTKGSKP